MDESADQLHVHVADPAYGAALDPREAEPADVDADYEGVTWRAITPASRPAGELAFVDGIQQIEAWLTASQPHDPGPIVAVAFAVAVGAVTAGGGRPARVAELSTHRMIVTGGDRQIELPGAPPYAWLAQTAIRDPRGLAARVNSARHQLERGLSERLSGGDRLVVLDGRLSGLRDTDGPVMGAVKSHQQMYLDIERALTITALRVGQRTPIFAIGTDRLAWYQRLPGVGEAGWAGILRGELARTVGREAARHLADRATTELPRFAGRPHRDPRAPQNLAPIGALEERLRRRLGDRRLALRAVRRAARGARMAGMAPLVFEGPPAAVSAA